MMYYTTTYLNDLRLAKEVVPNVAKLYNSNILVTGATGLVCSALVDFLMCLNDTDNAGIMIYVAARSLEKAKQRYADRALRDDFIFVKYNALNELEWKYSLDYIVHGASPANPSLYSSQPIETMLSNIVGLNNILDYTVQNNVKKVLFVSSSEVYGKKDNNQPYREDEYGYVDLLDARACYPSAKRACETLCSAYKDEYDVNSVIVRLGHVYGPTATQSDTRASSQFFYDVLAGHDIIMKSSGLQMRSYCYVVDCVSAIVTVLINGENISAYNISNSNSVVSIRELAEMIAACSGKKVVFEKPSDMELKGYNMMQNSSLSSAKLEDLGWKGQFDLETGVDHTLRILMGE